MGEKTRVRIQSSSLQSAGMGGSDAHPSFFAHVSHFGPSGGDFKASRRNCTQYSEKDLPSSSQTVDIICVARPQDGGEERA